MVDLYRTIHGSAHDIPLSDDSVQCIVTSPPYWSLRKYAGEQNIEWPAVTYRLNEWCEPITVDAMRCELGLESSPVAYIGHLILCLREWRRILRDDGVAFVNLGDSYNGSGGPGSQYDNKATGAYKDGFFKYENPNRKQDGLKPKDKVGIPELFVLAARADGWWWRSTIVWAKPNPMPESVTDRPTSAWEHVFLLAKSARYYYDSEAVKEEATVGYRGTDFLPVSAKDLSETTKRTSATGASMNGRNSELRTGRNLRNVWHIATQGTPEAHFATFPEKLVEPCIRAGTSARGACPTCGAPWARVTEKGLTAHDGDTNSQYANGTTANRLALLRQAARERGGEYANAKQTTGWRPTCECAGLPKLPKYPAPSVREMKEKREPSPEYVEACEAVRQQRAEMLDLYSQSETVPCVVCDPFHGSGTTGRVALREGRAYVGVDISDEYINGVTAERATRQGLQIGMGI